MPISAQGQSLNGRIAVKRLALVIAVGLALSACADATSTVNTAPPNSNAPAATGVAGSNPASGSTASGSKVGSTGTFFKSWDDGVGHIHYEIVIEVKNTGGKPANIRSGHQSYTILATAGTVLETGTFNYMFPKVLAPGELGYYIDGSTFQKGTKLASVGPLQFSLSFSDAGTVPKPWVFSSIKVAKDSVYGGAEVSGIVKNTNSADATLGTVGVVLFDANGNILGGVVDKSDVMNLRAGQSKGFKTSYPGTPPLNPSAVKSFKTFGLDYSFI